MFSNFLKQVTCTYAKNGLSKSHRLCSTSAKVVEPPLFENKVIESKHNHVADLDAALNIQASLFEHSKHEYNPTPVKEAISRARKQSQKKLYTPKVRPATNTQPTPNIQAAPRENVIVDRKSKIIDDPELGLQFVRLNLKDPLFSNLMTTTRSKKRRDKDRQIIVEGRRLILEALQCKLHMHALIFSQVDQLKLIKDEVAVAQHTMQTKIYKVPQHDLKLWSTLTNPPGLMGIFERPAKDSIELLCSQTPALPITVVCDNVREPNNLGSIIRSSAAIPCQQIIVTDNSCDPWESKALRGGCSGQFRVPIKDEVQWEDLPLLIPPETADNCCIFIAENNYNNIGANSAKINYKDLQNVGAHNVLIIGGESHGVSEEAYNFMKTVGDRGKCLYIPIANGIESLNVASALTLLLYELKSHLVKQRDAVITK